MKEYLIASIGMSPQLVTKALYYYSVNKPRRYFDKITLITTSKGKNELKKCLFDKGWLEELEDKLGLDKGFYPLSENDIVVLEDKNGLPLDDIRSSSEAEDEMTQIFNLMKTITEEESSRITVMVAGGRKTMSVTLALAGSLYCRVQDEMVHILSTDDNPEWLSLANKSKGLQVARIPFPKMSGFAKGIGATKPRELVELVQFRVDELRPVTSVQIKRNSIQLEGKEYQFSASQMMLWRYFARRKTQHCVRPELKSCGLCTDCYVSHEELIEDHDQGLASEYFMCISDGSAYKDAFIDQIQRRDKMKSIDRSYDLDKVIREKRSKLKRQIIHKVDDMRLFNHIQIHEVYSRDNNDKRRKEYGVQLDKNSIKFKD